jgi:predicted XRE-type DNA-binding protein
MALTRSMLKSMNLTDEQINAVIEEHTTAKDSLKQQIKDLEAKYADYDQIKNDFQKLSADVKKDNWKEKYDSVTKEFDDYKKEVEENHQRELKKEQYKQLLIDNNINQKQIESILEVTKFDEINLDDNNKLENVDEINEAIKNKWDGFIVKNSISGVNSEIPPSNFGGTSKDEIMKIKDPVERQQEIANHLELFT